MGMIMFHDDGSSKGDEELFQRLWHPMSLYQLPAQIWRCTIVPNQSRHAYSICVPLFLRYGL